MVKTTRSMLDKLKRNPDNSFYLTLREFCIARQYEIQEEMVKETDMDNVKRLQGRAIELKDMLDSLTRKPVVNKHDGAYGQ